MSLSTADKQVEMSPAMHQMRKDDGEPSEMRQGLYTSLPHQQAVFLTSSASGLTQVSPTDLKKVLETIPYDIRCRIYQYVLPARTGRGTAQSPAYEGPSSKPDCSCCPTATFQEKLPHTSTPKTSSSSYCPIIPR